MFTSLNTLEYFNGEVEYFNYILVTNWTPNSYLRHLYDLGLQVAFAYYALPQELGNNANNQSERCTTISQTNALRRRGERKDFTMC